MGEHCIIPIEVQEKIVAKHLEEALDWWIRYLSIPFHRETFKEMCMMRFSTIGLDGYGDKSFHLALSDLTKEGDAEIADALFYEAVRLARIAGELDEYDVA